jgi:hypothetical protein
MPTMTAGSRTAKVKRIILRQYIIRQYTIPLLRFAGEKCNRGIVIFSCLFLRLALDSGRNEKQGVNL